MLLWQYECVSWALHEYIGKNMSDSCTWALLEIYDNTVIFLNTSDVELELFAARSHRRVCWVLFKGSSRPLAHGEVPIEPKKVTEKHSVAVARKRKNYLTGLDAIPNFRLAPWFLYLSCDSLSILDDGSAASRNISGFIVRGQLRKNREKRSKKPLVLWG